jgi:predicted nucleic acid-binding protein
VAVVVDSSIAAAWSIPDEKSLVADRALTIASEDGIIVPQIFWYEIRNVLVLNERRARLTVEDTEGALARLYALNPGVAALLPDSLDMRLARKHSLTIYDAAYLALALREGTILATLDRKLAAAAVSESVAVVA